MRLLWGAALLALVSQGAAAGQPRLAAIEGVVVAWDTAAPIARAFVELRREEGAAARAGTLPARSTPATPFAGGAAPVSADSRTTVTGPDGTFRLEDVQPGIYRLYATRSNGYVPGEFGQRTPTGTGRPFTLTEGEPMTGVTLTMTPTGSITGRVVDAQGEPSGYAHVQALKAVYQHGHRMLTVMQLVQADERGEYRLFWLPPGEFYVCAKPLDLRRSSEMMHIPPPSRFGTYQQQMRPTVTAINASEMLPNGTIAEGQHVPVCFPGTRDERSAAPVRLDAGQQVGGIDISVADSLVRTYRVRGHTIDGSTGRPVAASLQFVPRNAPAILLIPTGRSGPDGAFDMWGALPGPGHLIAGGPGVQGLLPIDVSGGDIDGATLTMWPAFGIPGRIRAEGARGSIDEPDVSGITVTLRRNPPVNGLPDPALRSVTFTTAAAPDGSGNVRVLTDAVMTTGNTSGRDGTFALNGVPPGEYAVDVALQDDSYLVSIRIGIRDVLTNGLYVEGPRGGELEVVIGTDGAALGGRVLDAGGEPYAGAVVAAVPAARRRGRIDLHKSTTADEAGRFEFRGLAPGAYELFAWEDVEPGAWLAPEFMEGQAGRGQTISVSAGDRRTLDLPILPAAR